MHAVNAHRSLYWFLLWPQHAVWRVWQLQSFQIGSKVHSLTSSHIISSTPLGHCLKLQQLVFWFISEFVVITAVWNWKGNWSQFSPLWSGMGSGGSAGKEAGPLKTLLRQQTQTALEQRVWGHPIPICMHRCLWLNSNQYWVQFDAIYMYTCTFID